MVQLLAKDNIDHLQSNIGRMPTKGELYAAHFLGAAGASKLIKNADSTQPAYQLFPEQAKANRPIFYTKDMRPRSVAQVYQLLHEKVS
jgi:hypothetical protein